MYCEAAHACWKSIRPRLNVPVVCDRSCATWAAFILFCFFSYVSFLAHFFADRRAAFRHDGSLMDAGRRETQERADVERPGLDGAVSRLPMAL